MNTTTALVEQPHAWSCACPDGPGECHNHTPHECPRGCYHKASWAPDDSDKTEAVQS